MREKNITDSSKSFKIQKSAKKNCSWNKVTMFKNIIRNFYTSDLQSNRISKYGVLYLQNQCVTFSNCTSCWVFPLLYNPGPAWFRTQNSQNRGFRGWFLFQRWNVYTDLYDAPEGPAADVAEFRELRGVPRGRGGARGWRQKEMMWCTGNVGSSITTVAT